MKYTVAIAGTTHRTKQCAQALLKSDLFNISWVLTPIPKPVGRKQVITANKMDDFASDNGIITVWVDKKINSETKSELSKLEKPDFLLVVDFGYIIPDWLLDVPIIAPLNIHPSELPKWRGSSPGQFSILFNDKKSAVTLMVMDNKLDHGPIIHQDFFDVDLNWTQEDYYKHAFDLMCNNLDKKIADFAGRYKNYFDKNELSKQKISSIVAKPQPEDSPTIIAGRIKKNQAFVPWEHVQMAIEGLCPTDFSSLSELLQVAYKNNGQFALTLERASKAFNPWPNLWTTIQTVKGEKRMKIIETSLEDVSFDSHTTKKPNQVEKKLILKTVQIEGKNPVRWSEVKNLILN
jgi:methionyl-tRNA formyltransferase